MKNLILLCLLALVPITGLHAADRLEVPLIIDFGYLDSMVATSLGLDAQDRSELAADACNRLVLSEVRTSGSTADLELSMAITAHTGVSVFGKCTGLQPLESQLHIELTPQVAESGHAAHFRVGAVELRRPDGQRGMLSTPVRMLVEHLVLPHLETMKVDLNESLAAIDQLIEEFSLAATEHRVRLTERGRLADLAVDPGGLRAVLRFDLLPPLTPAISEPALDATELAQWQRLEDELDGFLTVIVVSLASQLDDRDLTLDLLAVLLDSRHQIAAALADDRVEDGSVRRLFLDSWTALSPLLARADRLEIVAGADLHLAGFVAAGDALLALDALGPEYGLEISRDGLRRLARLLLAERAPTSFTPLPLETDPALRQLFGLVDSARNENLARSQNRWWSWLFSSWMVPSAHAQDPPTVAEALRGLVPELDTLDNYLGLVARLISETLATHADPQSRVPVEYRNLFDPLVRATAWKESCWRHYEGTADPPRVIRSPVGAIGMMQIMGRVWRGVYDIERLEKEVEYNLSAGIEILEHYLVDYAVRRGEHERPGGAENLIRATYAAYNGGPSHLTRYRRDETPAQLQAIDNVFWRYFQTMRDGPWPEDSGCYAR